MVDRHQMGISASVRTRTCAPAAAVSSIPIDDRRRVSGPGAGAQSARRLLGLSEQESSGNARRPYDRST